MYPEGCLSGLAASTRESRTYLLCVFRVSIGVQQTYLRHVDVIDEEDELFASSGAKDPFPSLLTLPIYQILRLVGACLRTVTGCTAKQNNENTVSHTRCCVMNGVGRSQDQ